MTHFKKIKLVLIDENELFREGIKRILEGTDVFEVAWEEKDVTSLMDHLKEEPDIILIDFALYEQIGLEKMKHTLSAYPDTKLVLFTLEHYNHQILPAIDSGVRGYLTKEMDVNTLIHALKMIHKGKYWIHPEVTHDFVLEVKQAVDNEHDDREGKQPVALRRPVHLFTDREYEVLQLLALGYSNQRIAEYLGVTQSTVKNHVTSIFVKMKVHDRTQAVIRAIQHNWVEVGDANFEPLA